MQDKTLAQIWALALGGVLVLVGIVGFLVEPSFGVGDSAQRGTLIRSTSTDGTTSCTAVGHRRPRDGRHGGQGRLFSIGYGVVYVLVTILGFAVGDGGLLLSIIPINTADNLLHLAIAVTRHRRRPGQPRRQRPPRRAAAA